MKFDDTDPPRVEERGDPELARLVRASRIRRLSSRTTAQMAKRLTATSTYAAAARSATSPISHPGTTKIGVFALVGIGAALFAWQARTAEQPSPAPSETVAQAAALAPSSPSSLPPAPSPSVVETPSVPVEALPSSMVASASPRAVVVRPPASASASAPPPAFSSTDARTSPSRENEFALVRRAQDLLASDPSRTLALVQEHVRAFPAGELVQEREVIAVEALTLLDRTAEAKARADALRARYPHTPYGARLDRALGGPSSPAPPSMTAH